MNITQKIKSIYNKFFSGQTFDVKRDWNILLVIFLILLLASIGFDISMHQKIVSGDMYVSVNRNELIIENLKSNDLKKILDNFENKKAKITTLKMQNLVDPSI